MPTLSLYEFEKDDASKAGWFRATHASLEGPVQIHLAGVQEVRSVLVRVRPDDEKVLDLFAFFNDLTMLKRVDRLLGRDVHRLGPMRVSYVTWGGAQLRDADPGRHEDWELLVAVNIDFHVSLPWCADAGGTLVYYVSFSLDEAGSLRGEVDGGSFLLTGGYPACSASVVEKLDEKLPRGFSSLQGFIGAGLQRFTQGRRFSDLYLLPGRGERKGRRRWGNADSQVSLALLPS